MKRFILYSIILCSFILNTYSIEKLRFEHYNRYNGLPGNSVNSIYKDKYGFMWFCTDAGLIRYDGYSFVSYRFNSADNATISDDLVVCINEDESGKLWVGTRNGLNLFNPVTDKFIRIKLDEKTASGIQYNWVTAIEPCKSGGVWVASRSGLYRVISDSTHVSWINKMNSGQFIYQHSSVRMIHYTLNATDSNSLNDNGLYCLHEDRNGTLWIGSDNGGNGQGALHKLLPGEKTDYPPVFKKYVHDAANPNNTIGRYLMSIYEDRYGELWIGTWQEGLYRFNPADEKFKRFYMIRKKNIRNGINCNNIYSVTEDDLGNLWITTYGGGLNQIDANNVNSGNPTFIHYLDEPANEKGLSYQNLRSIYFDEYNQLWIGSLGNGLYKSRLHNQYAVLEHVKNSPNSLSDNRINYLFKDSNGNIWIASRNGILHKWKTETGNLEHYTITQSKSLKVYNFPFITEYDNHILFAFENSIQKVNVKTGRITDFIKEINMPDSLLKKSSAYQAIYIDSNNNLLISNSNFRVLLRKNKTSFDFEMSPVPDFLSCFQDSETNLWFSTRFEGLYAFDTSYNFILGIVHQKPDYNSGYGFVETKDSSVWASTSMGLLQYSLHSKKYRYFEEKDGLSSNDTRGIILDRQGYIWLSTNHGLTRFNPYTKQFYNLDENDGLPITNFNKRAFCKGNKGEFYFGSDEGVLSFHPDSIRFNSLVPRVYITDFKIFNTEVGPGEKIEGRIVLNKNILFTNEIILSHKSNVLQFGFAALNYLLPEENKYAYKMDGVDRDWNYVDADRRFTVYAGLQPGNYIFRVKASNNDGLWNNEGVLLKIVILPAFWQTWWFRICCFLIIIISIIILFRLRTNKIKQRNLELEQHVVDRTRQLEAANKELEAFSYSVSHDLRAPLRAIEGFSRMLFQEYYNKFDSQAKSYFDKVSFATQRMSQLIDDMLNLSKVSRSEMNMQQVDLSRIAQNISIELRESQPERNAEFLIQEGIIVLGDERLLRIVLENLLGNAWKFTSKHKKTRIEFGMQRMEDKPVYFVRDDGAGFDMSYAKKLFGAFQRLHTADEFPGNGIGLATVQRIIRRHGGNVWAEGELEKGTTIYFTTLNN